MDSDSDSPLSVISSEDLEELREELGREPGSLSIDFDEREDVDGDGFSTSQIAAAILKSRQQHSDSRSSAGPSGCYTGLSVLESRIPNGMKRKRSTSDRRPAGPRRPLITSERRDSGENIHSAEASTSKISDEIFPPSDTRTNATKLSPVIANGLGHSDHEAKDAATTSKSTKHEPDNSPPLPMEGRRIERASQLPELTSKAKKSKARKGPNSSKKAAKSAAARKTDRLWEVDTVVTDPDSPLVAVNIQSLLMKDEAWTVLSKEQQKQLISMLPSAPTVEPDPNGDFPNLLRATLQKSAAMKADIRLFKEDLSAGRLEPEWQLMARRAIQRRANGDFDEYEKQKREEIWGERNDESEADKHAAAEHKKGKGKGKRKKR